MVFINRMVAEGLLILIQIYYILLIARIIMSWLSGPATSSNALQSVYRLVYGLTEPLLAPIRKVIPHLRMGMGYIDLSPLILLFLFRIAQRLIYQFLFY